MYPLIRRKRHNVNECTLITCVADEDLKNIFNTTNSNLPIDGFLLQPNDIIVIRVQYFKLV